MPQLPVMREGEPEHARFPSATGPWSWHEYLTRLEETGRARGGAELRARYPDKAR